MMRLDHNRAKAQLAKKVGAHARDVKKMTIWGNHSATQYPDLSHAEVDGKPATELVTEQEWIEDEFIPTVQKRGAAIIEARGASQRHVCRQRCDRPRPRLGATAPPRATGSRWAFPRTVATRSPRA